MIDQPVILGFVPTSVTSAGSASWAVTAQTDDPLEINDGWMISRGDVVFLDLRASASAAGTVGRYLVASIVSKSSHLVSVILDWASVGPAVSPSECVGVRGYLAQPIDVVGTVSHPKQQTLLLPQEVIELAKDVERYAIGTEVEESEQVVTLHASEPIAVGEFVRLLPTGVVVRAVPQDPERMPATGIALTGGIGQLRIRVGGVAPRIASGLLPGAPVFIGDAGLPITDPTGITLPAAFQIVGVALDATTVSLSLTGSLVRRS